jgi:hypothetical protein
MLEIYIDELRFIKNPDLKMIFSLSDNSKTFILTYPEYDLKFE